MNPFLKSFLTLIFLFSTLAFLQAQNPGNRGGGKPSKVMLKGKIVDKSTNGPLEYATITLFSKKDSSMITGGITDETGSFALDARPGRFFAKVEFISYKAFLIEDIQIGREDTEKDLGTIGLESDALQLGEIEVRAEKSQMQMSLDKRVFNVGQDLVKSGGSAADILDNVPSVSVDIDGVVSLRGSENVRILIDGKPSGLVGTGDAAGLRQLSANLIDKVEVITNPSARYEAEGMSGIINIVLRQERKKGFNGSFDATVGLPEIYGGAFNLNYRQKNLNFFVNYGVRYRNNPGGGFAYQEQYRNDTTFILDTDRQRERNDLSHNIRFGSDFFINDKNTLTAAFNIKKSDQDNLNTLIYKDYINDFPSNLVAVTNRTDNEKEDEFEMQYSLNYKKTYAKKGRELTADIQFEQETETESSDFREEYRNSEGQPNGISDLLQRSSNEEKVSRWLMQVDYVHPFSKDGKFELGMRSSLRNISNKYLVEEFDDTNWNTLPNFSNDFDYQENIYSAYAIFGNKVDKFSYQLGLRAEYSDVTTELVTTNDINARDYFNVFPSVFLTYDLPNKNALQLSYSRRISRPRFWYLNPFFTFSDSRNFFGGNPNLDPTYTDSYELGHIKYLEKGSIGSSIYYRHSTGVVERIQRINEDGTTRTAPENLSTEDNFGVEFNYNYAPVKWWRFNGDFNFYYFNRDGGNLGEEFQAEDFTWTTRATSRVTLWKNLDTSVRVNYRAASATTQGSREGVVSVDLGASMDVLKQNGTLTLSVRDLFNSRRRRSETFGEDFYSKSEFQWRSRQASLTLTYRLNQKKQRQRGERGGGGDFDGGDMQF